jgi:hypothetical protein
LKGHFSVGLVRRIVLVIAVIGVGLGVASFASATGSSQAAQAKPVKRVFIRSNTAPHFVGPKAIHEGQRLKIINQTNPQQIGPHTFSLVKSSVIPRTRSQQRHCFNKGHICKRIARWHGSNGHTPVTINPVRAGHRGWDRAGDLNRRGDSFFAGHQGSSFRQRVTANGGVVLHFMCAIHPFMHKRIVVKP